MVEPRKLFGGLGNRLFQMAYIYAENKRGNIPDIYLQDPAYFEEYEDEIKRMYGTDLVPSAYISLHIRRGDYINNAFYADLITTDYYERAIAMFPNAVFLIFCADGQNKQQDADDIQWCEDWAKEKGIKHDINHSSDEITDFNRMAGCKGHICANSTFSLWTAYVGGGKTVAPKEYYSDGIQRTVWPKEFIVI